jgi:hypothetical protein
MATAQNTTAIVKRRGFEWNGFVGVRHAKEPMQAYAEEVGAAMQIVVMLRRKPESTDIIEKHTYTRHFVAVDDPIRFQNTFPGLPADENTTNEMILKDKPCKLCMHFDDTEGLPACFANKQDFTCRVQAQMISKNGWPTWCRHWQQGRMWQWPA